MYSTYDARDATGRRKPVRRELDAVVFGINQFDSEPHQAGAAHDELESGQHELYVALAGSGTIVVDGNVLAFEPGVYVYVTEEHERRVEAGPDGLSYLVVGASPGGYAV